MDNLKRVWFIKHCANALEESIAAQENAVRTRGHATVGDSIERYDSVEAIKRRIKVMREELLKLNNNL